MQYKKFITLIEVPFHIHPELNILGYETDKMNKFLTKILIDHEKLHIKSAYPLVQSITSIVSELSRECLAWSMEVHDQKYYPDDLLHTPAHNLASLEFQCPLTAEEFIKYDNISKFEVLNHVQVTKTSIAQWFLECNAPEKAKIFNPKINSPEIKVTTEVDVKKSNTFEEITHTSELIEVMKSAIIEHWEGIKNKDIKPKNSVVEAWIIEKHKGVSRSVAKNIASIIRPNKYK
jgi:hypothetical protein